MTAGLEIRFVCRREKLPHRLTRHIHQFLAENVFLRSVRHEGLYLHFVYFESGITILWEVSWRIREIVSTAMPCAMVIENQTPFGKEIRERVFRS